MFHDKELHQAASLALLARASFKWNADACKLALLVEWYKASGERILPVAYLKRTQFTAREWELATKGRRERSKDAKKRLLSKDAAPDGLEYSGIVREVRKRDSETGKHTTFWLIGEFDDEAQDLIDKEHRAILAARYEKDQSEVVEGDGCEESDVIEFEAGPNRQKGETKDETAAREAYDHGYAVGDADGYQRAIDSVASVLSKIDNTGTRLEWSLIDSYKRDHAQSVPVTSGKALDENPNDQNLSALLSECREQGGRIGAHWER